MLLAKARSIALFTLAAVLATGCATVQAPSSADALPLTRFGHPIGYLQPEQLPDTLALLPPPPVAGSAAHTADEEAYRVTRALRGTPRWALAAKDADLNFPAAAEVFSCALDMPITAAATPHLYMLLRRVVSDAGAATGAPKEQYRRRRPYTVHGDTSCTPKHRNSDSSYPSGHTSIGWAWALTLAELAPDRANAILQRGYAYGQSRVVCGVHWQSDVDAGRVTGAVTVAHLHADPVYRAQMDAARREIAAARAAGAKPTGDCAAEARALAGGR